MLMATIFSSLLGCGKKYTVEDIIAISLWESTMDRNASYSYVLTREGDAWYLSAECGNVGEHERFDCMYLPVDGSAILNLVKEGGYMRKTRSSKGGFRVFAPDAPSRGIALTFSDFMQQSAEIAAPALRDAFSELVAALEEGIPVYSVGETTGLYLSASCMSVCSTYSFELFRDDDTWHFSASCRIDEPERNTVDNPYAGYRSREISLSGIPIDATDADALLEIAFEEELPMKVFTYRELPDNSEVLDADIHRVSMYFGTDSGTADIRSEKLEGKFYALAEKYFENNIAGEG